MPGTVYYIETADGEPLDKVITKLGRLIRKSGVLDVVSPGDFTAVKIHFGEEGNKTHIRPELAGEAVRQLLSRTHNVFLTDTNVLYKDSRRTNAVDHLRLAHEHGFDEARTRAPVLIADGVFGREFVEVKINKKHFKTVKIAAAFAGCDSIVALSHVTGHLATGFAGAIKNLGMGCASRRGKYEQHSGVVPQIMRELCTGCALCAKACPASCIEIVSGRARISPDACIGCGECVVACRTKAIDTKWSETLGNLQEKMVEYAYGAAGLFKGKAVYINFLLDVTKDCDCLSKDEPKITPDLGMLASDDPVSIDMASADLLCNAAKRDIFRDGYPQIDWMTQFVYAAGIGLGQLRYRLEKV